MADTHAGDYDGPATFAVEGDEYALVVSVTTTVGQLASEEFPTGAVVHDTYVATAIELRGDVLPDSALDKTGVLRCADGQVFEGEFRPDGHFHLADLA